MKTKKLIPMTQFILDIDWMTTKEFCETYKIPLPTITGGVNDFLQVDAIKQKMFVEYALQVDAIKQKMFVEYAKFLNTDLREDMFTGENPIFPDFIKCTPKQAEQLGIKKSFDNFGKNEFMMRLFQKDYKAGDKTYDTWVTHFHLKKVEQLATFGLLYNER